MRLHKNRVCNALSDRAVCLEMEENVKDLPGVSKELEALAMLAYEQGWEISLNPQGKLMWRSPDKTKPLVYTSTHVNSRSLRNAQSQLVRSGLDVSSLKPAKVKEPTMEELAEQARQSVPKVAAVVEANVNPHGGYDEAMAKYLSTVTYAVRDFVADRGYDQPDAALEEALKLVEEAEKEIKRLLAQNENLDKQVAKHKKDLDDAKVREAALLERAVNAENKLNTLKSLFKD